MLSLSQCLLSGGDGSSPPVEDTAAGLCILELVSWALSFPTGGAWQHLHEASSVQMLALVVLCILSPSLPLAPTPQPCPSILSFAQSILGAQKPIAEKHIVLYLSGDRGLWGAHLV